MRAEQIAEVFNGLFRHTENTVLIGGAEEPVYLPAETETPNRIFFRSDFASSALHEAAHWCVAGSRRRTLVDFGYWYAPDGRDADQQRAFEQVEARPQALEWIFSDACGIRFRPSVDNLAGVPTDAAPFEQAIVERAAEWFARGLPPRASRLRHALAAGAGISALSDPASYTLTRLRFPGP